MPKEQFDPSVRLLGKVAAGLVFFLVAVVVASLGLNRESANPMLRGALVGLAMSGMSFWIWTTGLSIRAQDEYTRRVHLVALSFAFAGTGLFVFTADFLQRAGFLDYLPLTTIWLAMVGIWWLSMMLAARLYR
jgi:hypothetical protein